MKQQNHKRLITLLRRLSRGVFFLLRITKTNYGATREDIEEFTRIVMTGQGRLMANNYTELQENDVKRIYESVF